MFNAPPEVAKRHFGAESSNLLPGPGNTGRNGRFAVKHRLLFGARRSVRARSEQQEYPAPLGPRRRVALNVEEIAPVFALDSRLEQDTFALGDFPLCRLLLSKDANYPWFILVPRRAGISEIFQLDDGDRQQLWKETDFLSKALNDCFSCLLYTSPSPRD